METPFMTLIAEGLASHAIKVVRFEFPYMIKRRLTGKKSPPNSLSILQDAFLDQLNVLDGSIVIGGKSMGGRIATTILEESKAVAAIALGYPFHPPGKPEKLRVEHFTSVTKPLLVLQGTRDPFGKEDETPQKWLPSSGKLSWIPDGEHSFKPRKSSGRTLVQNLDQAVSDMVHFIRSL